MTTIPDNIDAHSKLKRVVDARKTAIETGDGIDWATAEHLAFGSLLLEGYAVREQRSLQVIASQKLNVQPLPSQCHHLFQLPSFLHPQHALIWNEHQYCLELSS